MNAAANLAQDKMGAKPTATANQDSQNKSEKRTMKACVWHGKEKVALENVPVPQITDPQDALIKVTGTTVCGSDLHLYHGEILQLKDGDILGHELMGIVDQVGEDVTAVKPGDRVVAAFNIACGSCEYCKKKLYTSCEVTNDSSVEEKLYGQKTGGIMGYSHFVGGFAGGQAEYTRIPFANNNLIKVPDSVIDEKALFLSDIVCTAYHAVWDAGCSEGETVGVWGAGPIGLHVVQWLRNVFKAKRIILVDNVEARLHLAQQRWGAEPVNFDEISNVSEHVNKIVPGGLDRVIDCAGFRYTKSIVHKVERAVGLETDASDIINECLRSVRKFGTIGIIADYAGYTNHFLIGALMEKGIRLIGCGQAPIQRHWHECLKHIQDGTFDPTVILTHRFNLDSIAEVYKRFDEKDAGMMKVFIATKFSNPPSEGMPQLQDA
ncbi:chaperonin 10-like protein [Radiomyces spectabilis]|uniref:chaperonin 10-like protein n=1 Tax=Radiomyces spectabilis TaxID=64574 RepID=UPI00221FB64D|nr:chaperonin 10-like protein [Radiomyces spectabilis]KAI8393872.1 chaperonin 10-like protein [Radiomyces spectabilis]